MKKTLTILVMLVAGLWAAACTSSNSAGNLGTNSGYDSAYREQTRSAQSYQQGLEPGATPGEPVTTLMMVGMETGNVYPGEDYFIYAVVDNPDKRELQYEWSISNGEILDVAEAERGRLTTVVDEAKAEALAAAAPAPGTAEQPAQPAEGGAPSTPGVTPPAGGAAAGTGATPGQPAGDATPVPPAAPASGTPSSGTPAGPPGSAAPKAGASGAKPAGAPASGPAPGAGVTPGVPASGGSPSAGGVPAISNGGIKPQDGGTDSNTLHKGNSAAAGPEADNLSPRELSRYLELKEAAEIRQLTKDEAQELDNLSAKLRADVSGTTYMHARADGILELRIVSGPSESKTNADSNESAGAVSSEQVDVPVAESGTDSGLTSSAQSAVQAARAALAELGTGSSEETGGGNVADELSPKYRDADAEIPAEASPSLIEPDGIRGEYQTWKDATGTSRRRPLGSAIPDAAEGPATAEDSFSEFCFTTDEPFIQWTPSTQGDVTIYVRVKYKDEVVTEVAELPVSVQLHEPELKLSDEFPDIIHEDDNVIIRVFGDNIPEFFKGLVTLTFDINVLSYRDAELGEFFDDAPEAKLFDAQPDKLAGRVLFAIDANTELTQLSGSDPVLYIKFKAKQDVTSQEQTALALVNDSSASYILDYNGDNILPIKVEKPAYRSEITQPPAQPEYRTADEAASPGQPATAGPRQGQPASGVQGGSGTPVGPGASGIPPGTTPDAGGTGTKPTEEIGKPTSGAEQEPAGGPSAANPEEKAPPADPAVEKQKDPATEEPAPKEPAAPGQVGPPAPRK